MTYPLQELHTIHPGTSDEFKNIHPLNIPGPWYTCGSDNCGTGVLCAPNNVCEDQDQYEFICKQPETDYENDQIIEAKEHDPFDSYRSDGLNHWTKQLILNWWDKRNSHLDIAYQYISKKHTKEYDHNTGAMYFRWIVYIDHYAESYIKKLLDIIK